MLNVLITGANSYIGDNVKSYLDKEPDKYDVSVKDTTNWEPKEEDFKGVDVVFNVAGIAHIKETKKNRHLYYEVNRNLVVKIAKAAKKAGVKQFILLSTMSVYGLTTGHVTKMTRVKPVNAYGASKAQADRIISKLEDNNFKFVCLRPPMVYGKGCKGNYQKLRRFAIKSPIFPSYSNKRSMLYIGNLCEFVEQCIIHEKRGVFFPQNSEYVNTSYMIRVIARENGRNIKFVSSFNGLIRIVPLNIIKKVFGDLTYEKVDMIDKYSFEKSIIISEK